MESPEIILSLVKEEKIIIEELNLSKTMEEFLKDCNFLDLKEVIESLEIFCILQELKLKALLHLDIEEKSFEELPAYLISTEEQEKLKEITDFLVKQEEYSQTLYPRPSSVETIKLQGLSNQDREKVDLSAIFKTIIKRYRKIDKFKIQQEGLKIEKKMQEIMEILKVKEKVAFISLIKNEKSLLGIILTFIAILELAKVHKLSLIQRKNFRDIWVWKRSGI